MRYVYILKSTSKDFHYIGSTNDIEKRVVEHQ
jgi:predicted GIY-YIG superfamily endonuclease